MRATVRRALLLTALGLAACASTLTAVHHSLPAALDEITLVEGHPQISPVLFPHGLHANVMHADDGPGCVACHHDLEKDPTAIPQRCTACHMLAYLVPDSEEDDEHDASVPHDHVGAPDL